MSQYQKLTNEQKRIRGWRVRRNALVSRILAENPRITRADALAEANQRMKAK